MNIRKIAQECGFSIATVSLALNGNPRISKETREKILSTAKQIGYQSSPAMRSLMTEIRRKPQNRKRMDIGFINSWSHPLGMGPEEPLKMFFEGASRRATELGYFWEELATNCEAKSLRTIEKHLHNRGFDGLLLFTPENLNFLPDFTFLKLPSLMLGLDLPNQHISCVQADHYRNVNTAIERLLQIGCRRIGFTYEALFSDKYFCRFQGAYLASIYNSGLPHIEPLLTGLDPMRQIAQFVEQTRCDGILVGPKCDPKAIMAHGGIFSQNVRIAGYAGRYESDVENGVSGVDERWEFVGKVGMDYLAKNIELHQDELADEARLILIPGTWVEGHTTQVLAKTNNTNIAKKNKAVQTRLKSSTQGEE